MRELSPQAEPSGWCREAPRRKVLGHEVLHGPAPFDQDIASGRLHALGASYELNAEKMARDGRTQVGQQLHPSELGDRSFRCSDPPDPQATPEELRERPDRDDLSL